VVAVVLVAFAVLTLSAKRSLIPPFDVAAFRLAPIAADAFALNLPA
jgi:hypothetical protein